MDQQPPSARNHHRSTENNNGVPLVEGMALARAASIDSRSIVLVEGVSDQKAVTTLARRRGRDLASEGVSVVPIGGATNISHFLELLGPGRSEVSLAGLCDAGEEREFRRRFEQAGFGSDLTRNDMERLGFYVCEADLEDELIRALGAGTVERVLDGEGELGSFRIFQKQPAQRDRSHQAQLRRFLGTRSGRKVRYGELLVETLDLDHVPRPLGLLLAAI